MVKQRIDAAFSDTSPKGAVLKRDIKQSQSGDCAFETKEEFITHLIRIGEIQKDTHHLQDDGFIHIKGTLKIDNRVKSGLNWNDVVTDNAIVERGKISRYQYLPNTYKGIKTSLTAPSLASYMQHNNYGAKLKDDIWYVDVLRIPKQAEGLDFSNVKAKLTLFYGQQISLSNLPYSENILGLSPYCLGIDCENAYNLAKAKGCGSKILATLKPKNSLSNWFGVLFSWTGAGQSAPH